jgi:hypothetical protein
VAEFNALMGDLRIVPPIEPNALLRPPTQADAWTQNTGAVGDWVQQQRQISAERGLWTGGSVFEGGHPTQAGVVDAVGQYGNALVMGTTAPMTPKLLPAMRVGGQRVTGANHQVLERDYPDLAGHPESELGFVNPAGRWLTRPQAFQYALDHGLIDPKRASEAQRFKDAMEESGNQRNLFLPSEWLKKLGAVGVLGGGAAAAGPQQPQ